MNAEPLDIYLDALDRAEADVFPPCCAECRHCGRLLIDRGLCAKHYAIVHAGFLCKHYEPKSPSDGQIPY